MHKGDEETRLSLAIRGGGRGMLCNCCQTLCATDSGLRPRPLVLSVTQESHAMYRF